MIRERPLPQFVRDLLASPPRRGQGLNVWYFKMGLVLHPYRSPEGIIALLKAATADQGREVSHEEIVRAVERSGAVVTQPASLSRVPTPAWPKVNLEQREAVLASGVGLVDLWELSPRRADAGLDPEEVIDALFPGNPLLCVGQSQYQFATRPRQAWRSHLERMQFIVPSPMSAQKGMTKEGKESEHTLANTGPRRFLVVEQDAGTSDDQASILYHLAQLAPLALVVHSGGKSIHGWFAAEGQGEELLRVFMRAAVALGADPATWTPSQFVRMPGGTRCNGNRQSVYFFNPEIAS